MTQHFTEHGRFIHVIPDGTLTHTMLGGEAQKPQCQHLFADPSGSKYYCASCGVEVVSNSRAWVEPLPPLAPSPWSPVAPTEPGLFWHWSGDHSRDQKMTLVDWAYLGLGGPRGLCAFPQMEAVSELGGFWRPFAQPAPDRFAETLATVSEKLLHLAKIMRHGSWFNEWAAVIEGVVETLRAAYAAKGGSR